MADPKNFRYDNQSGPLKGHKKPPKGLTPVVKGANEAPEQKPAKAAKPAPEAPEDLKERRKAMFAQMSEEIATEEAPAPQPDGLPFDNEEVHPAELTGEPDPLAEVPEEPSELDRFKVSLGEALDMPEMKSIQFGVIGTGQAGGRIAEQYYRFGYNAVVINTAEQDLAYLDIPNDRKLHMPYALGGAGKNLLIGQQAANEHLNGIQDLLANHMQDADQVMVCVGGGGGSGGGSIVPLLQAIMSTEAIAGLPIVVVFTLPMNDEGAAAKLNAVKTLERIAKMVNDGVLSSLIIVDNAKIQQLYPGVSVKDFWNLANFDIANNFNMFNTVSKCATNYDALDPMDFANIISQGGCLIYGHTTLPTVTDEQGRITLDEDDLAKALLMSAQEGALAEGFDIRESLAIGVVITGRDEVLSQIPALNINYAFNVLADNVGEECTVYRGVYANPESTGISVNTIFSGLGLPGKRIQRLRDEAEAALQKRESKARQKKLSMSDPDGNRDKQSYDEIKQRNSPMGRMINKRKFR